MDSNNIKFKKDIGNALDALTNLVPQKIFDEFTFEEFPLASDDENINTAKLIRVLIRIVEFIGDDGSKIFEELEKKDEEIKKLEERQKILEEELKNLKR
jgi:hypothetical protein